VAQEKAPYELRGRTSGWSVFRDKEENASEASKIKRTKVGNQR